MARQTFKYEEGLLYQYLNAPGNPGVYVTWEPLSTARVFNYAIFRSLGFVSNEFPTAAGPGITSALTGFAGTLNSPYGIAFDSYNNGYILDRQTTFSQIIKFKVVGSSIYGLATLTGISTYASIYIDSNDYLYISERNSSGGKLLIYDVTETGFGNTVAITGAGTAYVGSGNNIVASNYIYNVHGYRDRVFIGYTTNSVSSTLLQFEANYSSSGIQLDVVGVSTSFSNSIFQHLFLSNQGNASLSGFSNSEGVYYNQVVIAHYLTDYDLNVATILGTATTSNENGSFNLPFGTAIDNAQNLYVCDTYNHRVQKFRGDGVYESTFGSEGRGFMQFDQPVGINLDKKGNLFMTDYVNQRIQYSDLNYQYLSFTHYPTNEYVDSTGAPNSYYYIKELDEYGVTLNNIGPIVGEDMLIKASLSYELSSLLCVPIYDEEPLFSKDRTKARLAYDNIVYSPRPEIRMPSASDDGFSNPSLTLTEYESIYKSTSNADQNFYASTTDFVNENYPLGLKYKLDYQGAIYFVNNNGIPVSIKSYDTVLVTYYVKLFTGTAMNNALQLALNSINSQPGSSKYPAIASVPFYYDTALITGAAYFLIKQLLLSLTQRERRLLIYDPDFDGTGFDPIANLKDLLKIYKEDFDALLKSLPIAQYPKISSIVVPEYSMPGGRSRYFRFVWKGDAS